MALSPTNEGIYSLLEEIHRARPGLRAAFAGETNNLFVPPSSSSQAAVPPEFNPQFPQQAAPAPAPAPTPDSGMADLATSLRRFPLDPRLGSGMPVGSLPAARPPSPAMGARAASELQGYVPPTAQPTPLSSASGEGGPLGKLLPPKIRNALLDALVGLGYADPHTSFLNAAGQGAAGAINSQQARQDRKAALATAETEAKYKAEDRSVAASERTYQHGRDTRSDKISERDMTLKERKAALEDRSANLAELQARANIAHTIAETQKIARQYMKNGLTIDQMNEIEKRVIDYGKTLNPGSLSGVPLDEDQIKSQKAAMDTYRQEQIDLFTKGQVTPGGDVEKGGASFSGSGSYDDPITFPNTPDRRSVIERLPPNTYFIDPVDGQKHIRR